jgi:hypothetical protein
VGPGSGGLPGPLTKAIDPKDHLLVRLTSVPPPDVECNAAELGVEATTAVSGTPGHYTPTNSYGPADLADAVGLTASPTTKWAAGAYVVLRDGSVAHWTGSAWAAGPSV